MNNDNDDKHYFPVMISLAMLYSQAILLRGQLDSALITATLCRLASHSTAAYKSTQTKDAWYKLDPVWPRPLPLGSSILLPPLVLSSTFPEGVSAPMPLLAADAMYCPLVTALQ